MFRLDVRSRLTRVTTSGSVIPVIDGLRFIAIAGVVLFHGSGYCIGVCPEAESVPYVGLMRLGWFGVELFFVISGFILARGFVGHYLSAGPPVSMRAYYMRRLTRLEPPYLIALLVYFTCKTVLFHIPDLGPSLLASSLYTHNFVFGERSHVLGVAWSLEIEVQFYLLVPLLARLFVLRPLWLRRLALLLLIVGLNHLARTVEFRVANLLEYLHFFLTGFLLCDIYWVDWKEGTAILKSRSWDLIGGASWVLVVYVLSNYGARHALIPLLLLTAYIGAFRGVFTSRVLSNPFIYVTGGMCYTIYLYHTLVLRGLILELPVARVLFAALGPAWGMVVVLVVAAMVLLPLTAVLFVLFERPFMRRDWPQRLRARFQSPESCRGEDGETTPEARAAE